MNTKNTQLAQRISAILIRLNQGQRLSTAELAEEFNVSLRTIERDFKERLGFFQWLENKQGFYQLDCKKVGILTTDDIQHFASFACISNLLPRLDKYFFEEMLQQNLLVKGTHYENINHLEQAFSYLNQAISEHRQVKFSYQKKIHRHREILSCLPLCVDQQKRHLVFNRH